MVVTQLYTCGSIAMGLGRSMFLGFMNLHAIQDKKSEKEHKNLEYAEFY